jgi:hypothetical protein
MPEPLPDFDPAWPRPDLRVVVPDGPYAVSLMGLRAAPEAPQEASAEPARAPVPAAPEGAPADTRPVTDTLPTAVTDTLSAGVTDADADADDRLPAIAGFGREMSRPALLGLAVTRNSGVIMRAAGKGAVTSATWTAKPQSMAGHAAWVTDKKWIPEEVKDEPLVKFLVFSRGAWGWTFGLLFTGAGNAVNWLRLPQHFLLASVACTLLYLFVIR